ncbi:hypothetical protein ID866_6909 [Astraeus odoratus]|nr:hypothetical protein ID866_6909 [Astraeus odoratus]
MEDQGTYDVPVTHTNSRSTQSPGPSLRFPDRFLASQPHDESSGSSSFLSAPQEPVSLSKESSFSQGKRRPRSSGLESLGHDNKTAKKSSVLRGSRRRSRHVSQGPRWSELKVESLVPDFQPSAFSDEYDLYPKILQDVQRALQLQSRRRDRKSFQAKSSDGGTSPSTAVNDTLLPRASSSKTSPVLHTICQPQVPPLSPEVDFSPSTRSVPLHPVPISSNGGTTLDWTGSQSEDEKLDRLWPLHRGKRKGKERLPPSNRAIIEKQEAIFADRIARIKTEASAATSRKASIVKEQLGRHYNVVFSSMSNGDPINLSEVVRWYSSSTPDKRAWLDSAEPLTWLKHLINHQRRERSKWHVSALLLEEYTRSKRAGGQGQKLSSVSGTSSPEFPYRLAPYLAKQSSPFTISSDTSPSTSANRIHSSDHLSFGPRVNYSRDSINDSQDREEGKRKRWRRSLPGFIESTGSHLPSVLHKNTAPPGGLSPSSSRHGRPDFIHRFRRRTDESDEAFSVLGSQSEDQHDFVSDVGKQADKSRREVQAMDWNIQPPQQSTPEFDMPDSQPSGASAGLNPEEVPNVPQSSPLLAGSINETGSKPSRDAPASRSYRSTSLPLGDHPSLKPNPDHDESKLEAEYDSRWRILEDLKGHNHRLRHRMQRIAADVREYDILCSSALPALGIPYRSLPPEFLDAIGHDPSAVTGGTRRYHGWQAVDDIHDRVVRQREILKQFLAVAVKDKFAVPDVLENPITNVMVKLEALEKEQQPLRERAEEVNEILAAVKTIHGTVKQEYNEAVSQTSVVYPELSNIAALVEKYQDPYQQVWEFGMDALTFILDTITPFWRNYGKTIGEDMQDFLIIPWYRNDFTGEVKRYPVESFPRRSLRHWLALLAVSSTTLIVTFLQARAAITSTSHYRLLWMDNQGLRWTILPIFWTAIIIQWFAVIIELSIVFLQAAVVAWWLGWFVGLCT